MLPASSSVCLLLCLPVYLPTCLSVSPCLHNTPPSPFLRPLLAPRPLLTLTKKNKTPASHSLTPFLFSPPPSTPPSPFPPYPGKDKQPLTSPSLPIPTLPPHPSLSLHPQQNTSEGAKVGGGGGGGVVGIQEGGEEGRGRERWKRRCWRLKCEGVFSLDTP